MSSVIDVWRAVDPGARLVSSSANLDRPVRGVQRTRAAPPHLPPDPDGALLVADGAAVGGPEVVLAALGRAELAPAAVMLTGLGGGPHDPVGGPVPILVSEQAHARLAAAAEEYLADEAGWLARRSAELRLLCAEAALSEPEPATPAGLVAASTHRGAAVAMDGVLVSLHPRAAGRALAARFAALHARLLADGTQAYGAPRSRAGLWLFQRRVGPRAALWLFDDLPLAAVDEVAAEAAAVTLRALLHRRPTTRALPRTPPAPERAPTPPAPAGDRLTDTLLAVARHNGRVSPAARELGVHRNTVLYRLKRARSERGLDPRRPDDALRILASRRDD